MNKTIASTLLMFSFTVSGALAQDCGSRCGEKPVALVSTKQDIVDTAVAAGAFKTLVTAVTAADLVSALKAEGPFTVFAPSDSAFAKLPKGTIASLLKPESKGTLTSILGWHVVPGRFTATQVVRSKFLPTLNGQRLPVSVSDAGVMVGGAMVTKTDIECSNGIIHILGEVMMPASKNLVATAQGAGTFKTLLTAATKAGLAPTLAAGGPFTIFAPTDAAFAKLPAGTLESLLLPENKAKLTAILKYHVVKGRAYSDVVVKSEKVTTLGGKDVRISLKNGKAYANDATIVATDIDSSNGVIHVIDTVLLPH